MDAKNLTNPRLSSTTLPLEIKLEIFLRLPSKSLQRLKSIFDDDDWVKSLETFSFQHEHAFNVLNQPTNERLLIPSADSIYKIDLFNPNTVCVTQTYNIKQLFKDILPYSSTIKLSGYKVIGATNGLICIYFRFHRLIEKHKLLVAGRRIYHHLVLWNPCTGEYHQLPNPEELYFNFNRGQGLEVTVCGFGYDAVNKTYKLVMAQNTLTHIYDLSTNTWKIVETIDINWSGFPYMRPYQSHCSVAQLFGIFLNGALHWIVSSTEIVAIDLSTGVYTRLNLPQSFNDAGRNATSLGVFKGCLSISCAEFVGGRDSIWVMKEYGRSESWTNIQTIVLKLIREKINDVIIITPRRISRPPLSVSQYDEMWFIEEGRLAFLVPHAEKLTYVEHLKFGNAPGVVHIDTLVSPKPEIYRHNNMSLASK